MPSIKIAKPRTTFLASLALVAAAAAAMPAGATARASKEIPQTSCFWTDRLSSLHNMDDALNRAFPDTGAVYWTSNIQMPPGSRVVLHGRYAHARYQSLNTYDETTHAPTDALNDVSTKPDPGSTNPYRAGARRDLRRRNFTATILNESPPVEPAPNTLYAGVPGQPRQLLIYRVYLPDRFADPHELTGGVGVPRAELELADGAVLSGQAACDALAVEPGSLPLTTLPEPVYDGYRDQPGKPPTFPADDPPIFRAFYNIGFSLECGYNGNCAGSPVKTGGQYSNIDNEYVAAFLNRGFADGPVLMLRGKLPTTAETGAKVKRMRRGQLRYWSLCQNESLFTTRGAGCVWDDQVPLNDRRRYTIVTSLAADRPENARQRCGVAFVPWPPAGDGAGHLDDGLLIVRNMLPARDFDKAVQDTRTPGDEAEVMGPYLPRGTYTTERKFEQRGC